MCRMVSYRIGSLFACLIVIIVSACGGGNSLSDNARGDSVAVFAAPNMNGGYPVELDLVFVKSEDVAQAFDIVPAKNWFRNRAAFLASYVGRVEAISYEILPGKELLIQNFPIMKSKAAAVFIYANYQAGAEQPRRIRRIGKLLVEMQESEFFISSENSF
ncbi:MAG: hypothetical protein AAFP70_10870 [Calditrichota bacterium]